MPRIFAVLLFVAPVIAGEIEVKSVTLCSQVSADGTKALDKCERFAGDPAAIHAVVSLGEVATRCLVRGTWISIDAINVPNYEIGSADVEVQPGGPATAHYSLSRPTNGWPAGRYELRVSVEGKVLATAPFEVAGGAAVSQATAPGTKVFRHRAGFSFRHPEKWTIEDNEGLLLILPPDVAGGPDAPTEMYFLGAESIAGQGIDRPDDAKIVEYLDSQVASMSPALKRTPTTESLGTASGKAALMEWQATGAGGESIRARSFAVIVGDQCVLLIAIGSRESLDRRDAEVRALFSTMSRGDQPEPAAAPNAPTPRAAPGAPDDELRRKLDALEKAHQAGVLSDEEYARKKAELAPPAPAIDPETRKKLDALEAARAAGVITEQEYAAKKAAILGEAAAPAAGADAGLRHVTPAAQGKTYRHAVGFSFWYPADWQLSEGDQFLQLTPADPAKAAAGVVEFHFVVGESVADSGITDPGDARVAEYLDAQVQSLAAFLQRGAPPKPLPMEEGKGVLLDWSGQNPQGEQVLARARVTIVKDWAVALISLGYKAPIEKREPDLRRVFASFRLGEGRRDPALAGRWNFLKTASITNWSPFETSYSRAQLASDSSSTLVLAPDGAWTRVTKHSMIVGAGGVWLESKDEKREGGKWYAEDGRLVLLGEKDTWEEYKYEVRQSAEGRRLVLITGNKGEIWGGE